MPVGGSWLISCRPWQVYSDHNEKVGEGRTEDIGAGMLLLPTTCQVSLRISQVDIDASSTKLILVAGSTDG